MLIQRRPGQQDPVDFVHEVERLHEEVLVRSARLDRFVEVPFIRDEVNNPSEDDHQALPQVLVDVDLDVVREEEVVARLLELGGLFVGRLVPCHVVDD